MATNASEIYSRLQRNRVEDPGMASALVRRLIAIQSKREEKARQDQLDAAAEEDRQRRIKAEEEKRAIRMAELAQKVAAMSDRKGETKDVKVAEAQLVPPTAPPMTPEELAVHEATGTPAGAVPAPQAAPPMDPNELAAHLATGTPAGAPELPAVPSPNELGLTDIPEGTPDSIPLTVKQEVRTPTPTHKLRVGDMELDVPLLDRTDIRERGMQDLEDQIMKETALQQAKERIVVLPNDPKLGQFAGKEVPLVLAQTLLPAMYRRTGAPTKIDLGDRVEIRNEDGTTEVLRKNAPPRTSSDRGDRLRSVFDIEQGLNDLVSESLINENPDRYRAPMPAAQVQELEKVTSNMAAFGDLKASLEDVKAQVGPGLFQLNELRQKVPGFEADPAFRAFQQQMNSLTNEEIKRITGAQMSASEFDRLKKGMVDGSLRLDELENGLYIWERSMQRRQASLIGRLDTWLKENPYDPPHRNALGGSKKKTSGKPTGQTPQSPTSNPSAVEDLISKYTKKGTQ